MVKHLCSSVILGGNVLFLGHTIANHGNPWIALGAVAGIVTTIFVMNHKPPLKVEEDDTGTIGLTE